MGDRTERMLMEDVEELGWLTMRAPASGSRPQHYPGDIWIVREITAFPPKGVIPLNDPNRKTFTQMFVVEEKYKANENNKYLQEDGDKFDKMIQFAEDAGAIPLFAGRWSTRQDWSPGATHFITDARDIERTNAGNVSVKPETAENWDTTEGYFG